MNSKILQSLRSRWIKHVLLLIALAGFTWQVTVVSIEYFGYKTTTIVSFGLRSRVGVQISAICVRYRDVIDTERIKKETGIKFAARKSSVWHEEQRVERLTIEQIFEYTPDADGVISNCVTTDSYGNLKRSKECRVYFEAIKYFKQEHICYQFHRKQKDDYPIESVTHSMRESFLIYEITFNDKFKELTMMEAMMFSKGYPYLTRDYAVRHRVSFSNKTRPSDFNYLFMSLSDVVVSRLEKPYDTACLQIGPNVGFDCLVKCKVHLYGNMDRVPASEILTKPHKLRPFSEADKKNSTMLERKRFIDHFCRKECNIQAVWCHLHMSITTAVPTVTIDSAFGFSANTAKQPDLYSRSRPVMTFIAYFSLITSCLGTWFGVSALSLNPQVLRKYWTRKAK